MSAPRSRRTPGRFLLLGATLVAAAAFAAATTGSARAAGSPKPLERTVLKNGFTLYRLERTGLPLVQMQLLIPAGGAVDPPGKEGVAALTARLLSRGSGGLDATAFAEQVEFLGGAL